MNFTMEEMNLMCIYDTSSHGSLLSEIRESLPDVYDPELRQVMESAIAKLETISEDNFKALAFSPDWGL